LQYHLEALEARLDTAFNLASDVEIEFDVDAILRTDLDVRFTAYKEGIQSGFLTINEARAQEGYPNVEGGDEPMMQVQFRPLSVLAVDDPVVAPPGPAAPAPPAPPTPPEQPKPSPPSEQDDAVVGFVRYSDILREEIPEHVA
jgi:hypothetical protein